MGDDLAWGMIYFVTPDQGLGAVKYFYGSLAWYIHGPDQQILDFLKNAINARSRSRGLEFEKYSTNNNDCKL